ncbi:MAG: TonB-dependent receptor domain-containing protein [Mangrovibacterium sp.]
MDDKNSRIDNKDGAGFRSVSTLNYDWNINDNNRLSLMVGNEIMGNYSNNLQVIGNGFPDSYGFDEAIGLIQTADQVSTWYDMGIPSHSVSFFGRANYSLDDKYLFTATLRADGSSKFAPNNRWGYFPAAAFAWRMSEEDWMKSVNWIDNLKIRLSYGESGSDNIDPSLWEETWETASNSDVQYEIDGEIGSIYKPQGLLENPNLKWETF